MSKINDKTEPSKPQASDFANDCECAATTGECLKCKPYTHPLVVNILESFKAQVRSLPPTPKYPLAIIRAGRQLGYFTR